MSENTKTQVAIANSHAQVQPSIYSSDSAFESAMRFAKQLCVSDFVPDKYKNNISNTLIALEMAYRTGASPLMVMQNMHVIQGKPGWSSAYVIAALNSCGRFTPLRFKYQDQGPKEVSYEVWEGPTGQRQKVRKGINIHDKSCVAFAYDQNGQLLEGPSVSVEMAVKEGWYTKSDSKWPTMTDLMLSYRSATHFGRLYAPDVLMGMQTMEELNEVHPVQQPSTAAQAVEILNQRVPPAQPESFDTAHIMDEEIK